MKILFICKCMRWIFIYLTLFLAACGGGGGGSAPDKDTVVTAPAPPPQPEPGYTISGVLTGLNSIRDIELKVNDQSLLVKSDGNFSFNNKLQTGTEYEVEVERESARQDCEITNEKGTIDLENISNVRVVCEDEKNLSLFSLDTLNKIRLTMTLEEWMAFILDTARSNYSVRSASGPAFSLSSWTHSEVYRQADFDFIDDEGTVVESIEKVGFKMQGNTSRQFPVDDSAEVAGTGQSIPQRFSFSIKFDEEFEDDESVYSCIDTNGNPAAVDNDSCFKIVGQDIPEYKEADGREFRDFEKLRFRYNRDDPTYQREVLAHDILNQIGVPTARATHISIEFVITGNNNQTLLSQPLPQTYDMGVFIMVEQIDKPFLKSYFDKNGYLFKVGAPGNLSGSDVVNDNCVLYEDSNEYFNENFCVIGKEKSDPESREEWLGTENYQDPDFVNSAINKEGNQGNVSQFVPYKPTYDLKTKKKSLKEARAELISFAKFVQTYPTPEQLATRFDVPGFIKAQAAEIVLGAVDHYVRVANNYYLYFNEPSNKWVYIPTDFDYTLIDIPSIDCDANPDHPLCNTGFLNFNKTFRDIIQTRAFSSPG